MVTLDRISPVSFARVSFFFGVIAGVIAGLIMALIILFKTGSWAYALLGLVFGIAGVTIAAAVMGALDALFYNFAAELVGGVKVTFLGALKKGKSDVLKNIDIIQYGKVEAVMLMLVAMAVGVIVWLVNAAVHVLPVGDALALEVLVVVIVLFGVVGFVAGALTGAFYNFGAKKLGGVKFDLENNKGVYNKTLSYIDYMSFAKIYVVIVALWGIIQLVLRLAFGAVIWTGTGFFAMRHAGTFWVAGSVMAFIASVIFGFVMAIIMSLLYNAAVGRIGGVGLKLK